MKHTHHSKQCMSVRMFAKLYVKNKDNVIFISKHKKNHGEAFLT